MSVTIQDIPGTEKIKVSRPKINSNFGNLKAAVEDLQENPGGGDVSGPNSSVDGNIAVFDGTDGKTIKDSGESVSDLSDTIDAIGGIASTANATANSALSLAGTANSLAGDVNNDLTAHKADTTNPHSTTKTQVGLSAVTNDAQVKRSEMGADDGVATLDHTGKLTASQIPPISIVEYLGAAANQTNMLALLDAEGNVPQRGDWCVREDTATTWIVSGNNPSTDVTSWTQLSYPTAPVQSVAGRTGAVILTSADVGLDQLTNDQQIPLSTLGQADGPAVLDGSGVLEAVQLPFIDFTSPASGQILIGNTGGTKYMAKTMAGDATLNAAGVLTIGANKLANSKLAQASANTVKCNPSSSTANVQDLAMTASTILARLATGDIVPASITDILTLLGLVVNSGKRTVGITIGDGTNVIVAGMKGMIRFPWAGTITKVSIAETSDTPVIGSVSVDVWKDTHANYPPTSADKISSSAPIALASANHNEDSTLTGWTKTVAAGDWFAFNVTGTPATVKRVTAIIEITLS